MVRITSFAPPYLILHDAFLHSFSSLAHPFHFVSGRSSVVKAIDMVNFSQRRCCSRQATWMHTTKQPQDMATCTMGSFFCCLQQSPRVSMLNAN